MKKWTEEKQVKVLFVIMMFVLVAILVPLFVISHYNFRSADDYSYAQAAEMIWDETRSVFKVLGAQVIYAWEYYNNWQGTYFFEWLSTSLMGFFSRDAYYICTYLSLGGLVICEIWAFMTILGKCLGADKYRSAIMAIGCICLQVLLTPVPVEAYYWFCGCILYTFFHAIGWFLVGLSVQFYFDENRSKAKRILLEIAIIFVSFAVAGSNYVTGISIMLFYFFYVVWMFYKKHKSKILAMCNGLFYIAAFALNIAAPGNTKRLISSDATSISVFEAIVLSIKEAIEYVFANTIPPCIILGVLLIPIILSVVKKRNYRYPWPILVSLISFGMFAAQFAPTMYTLQIAGAGRILNIYRFNFYVLLLGNEIYWLGWLYRRYREKYDLESLRVNQESKDRCWLLPGWIMGGMILCVCLYFGGGSTITSLSAVKSLSSGEAKQYYAEYQERMEVLQDESIQEAYLPAFSVKPYLLFFTDIVEDTSDWVNQSMSGYFGKEKIGLIK